MIEIVVCKDCPHCERQVEEMQSFASSEYRIIRVESDEFSSHDMRDEVNGVPFIIVRNAVGKPVFSAAGFQSREQLEEKILSCSRKRIFNLSRRSENRKKTQS